MIKDKTLWSEEELDNTFGLSEMSGDLSCESVSSSKEVVTLNMVDKNDYKECVNYFKREVEDSSLNDIVKFLEIWLKNKVIVLKSLKGEVVSNKIVDRFLCDHKLKKGDRCGFIALFFSDSENIRLMMDQCPPAVKEVFLNLLDCLYISADELYKKKNGKLIMSRSCGWSCDEYSLHYPWFCMVAAYFSSGRYSSSWKSFLGINHELFHFFIKAYGQEVVLTRGEISEGEGLNILHTEAAIVNYYPIIFNLYQQKILIPGKNDKILVSTVRKCAKQVVIDEFFPSSTDLFLRNLRASFVFPLFYDMLHREGKKVRAVQDILKGYIDEIPYQEGLISLLLPHIKGISSGYVPEMLYMAVDDIWKILSEKSHANQWISVRGLFYQILKREGGFGHLHLFEVFNYSFNRFNFLNVRHNDEFISFEKLKEELFEPFLKASLVLLSAIGLLDVAYRDYSETDRSWVDWLEYVRLTDLGKYVFGITDSYESREVKNSESYFALEYDRLILRSLKEDNPFVSFLEDVAMPIGNCRYVFSFESFLKNSIYKNEVDNKIDFFKHFICEELPPVWEDFFKNLKKRCHPLTTVSNQNFSIFKLDPENKELLHILSTDEILKGMVIRAEGYMILVEHNNKSQFAKRMKNLGFML